MLTSTSIRTFPCPQCGAILTTGAVHCDACSAPIDAAAAEAAADRREQFLKAFADANSLVLSARMFLLAFGLSFVPFLGSIGVVAVAVLLIQVPLAALRWYRRFWKLDYPDPELGQARRWWKEALGIWVVAALATPVWIILRFGGRQ